MNVTLFVGNEWEGLYVDGYLTAENHTLSVWEVLVDIMNSGKPITSLEQVDERGNWLVELGNLPTALEDLKQFNKGR